MKKELKTLWQFITGELKSWACALKGGHKVRREGHFSKYGFIQVFKCTKCGKIIRTETRRF
jgi:hypothetical protein